VITCQLETEPALPEQVLAQDAAQATAPDRAALAALVDAVDEAVVSVAV